MDGVRCESVRSPRRGRPNRRIGGSSSAKAPGCLAERIALAEAEAAHRPDAENDGAPAPIGPAERAVADDEMPGLGAVLRRERLGDRLQLGLVSDVLRPPLEHDTETARDEIAASRGQDTRRVPGQVLRLALVRAGGKAD